MYPGSRIERFFGLFVTKVVHDLPAGINAVPKHFDVKTIRLIPEYGATAASFRKIVIERMVDFSKMAESAEALVEGLKRVERKFGTVTAFALGALLAAGITDPKELVQNALKIDLLFRMVKKNLKQGWSLTEKDKIAKVREELWQMVPHRFAGSDIADNFELNKILDKYLQFSGKPISDGVSFTLEKPIGDCVSLTLIDNLIFMKFGIAIGVRAYSNHICSTTTNLTFDNTIKDFSEAIRLHAETAEKGQTLNYLGFIALLYNCGGNYLSYQGKMDEAQKAYDRALEFLPDHATIYNNRANHKCIRKDYVGAEDDYREAIRLEPNSYFYIGRAMMYFEKGETAKAIQDIQKAYEQDPTNPDYQALFKRLGLAQFPAGIIPRLIAVR